MHSKSALMILTLEVIEVIISRVPAIIEVTISRVLA